MFNITILKHTFLSSGFSLGWKGLLGVNLLELLDYDLLQGSSGSCNYRPVLVHVAHPPVSMHWSGVFNILVHSIGSLKLKLNDISLCTEEHACGFAK